MRRLPVALVGIGLAACTGGKPADTSDTGAHDTQADTGDTSDSGSIESGDSVPVDTNNRDSGDSGDSGASGDSGDSGDPPDPNLYPVAPAAGAFMWQGVQESFVRGDGTACTGEVTLAVGATAVCYVDATGALQCSGAIHGQSGRSTFGTIGPHDASQVFLSPRSTASDDVSLCALAGGSLTCTGDHNDFGQFGAGSTGATTGFVTFGIRTLTRVATGSWDQLCGLDSAGQVWCAGYGHGSTPELVGAASTFWVDTDATEHRDDSRTWRASAGRSEARLTSTGLDCDPIVCRYGALDGTTGLVDAVAKERLPPDAAHPYPTELCWLTSSGAVSCTNLDASTSLPSTVTRFSGLHVLAIAGAWDNDTLCAVADDGSLWCIGGNEHGQLGLGDTADRSTETLVVPPGGVRVDCR